MCWVMPPRSPAATSVARIASSRLVLPWSTWPMTVTMGARGCMQRWDRRPRRGLPWPPAAWAPRRSWPRRTGRYSALRASATSKPSSLVTSAAVSRSSGWLMLAKMPLLISSRMTSAGVHAEHVGELLDGDRVGNLDRAARATARASGRRCRPTGFGLRGGLRGPRMLRVPLLLRAIDVPPPATVGPSATLISHGSAVRRRQGHVRWMTS